MMRRTPPLRRARWTTRRMPAATYWRTTGTGNSSPVMATIISKRERASRVSLAWIVVSDPS